MCARAREFHLPEILQQRPLFASRHREFSLPLFFLGRILERDDFTTWKPTTEDFVHERIMKPFQRIVQRNREQSSVYF